MFNKQKPMRPETDEEIARYRKLGLIFTTKNPLLDSRRKKDERLSSSEASFCKKHKLSAENYIKIKNAFIKNGRQSVINIFRRNRMKISKCDEVIEFLSENIK